MKNQVVWLTALLLAGFILTGTASAQEVENLLDNGDFETGSMSPWTIYAGTTGANGEVVQELDGAAVPEDPVGDYCLHVVVPEAGDNAWSAGLQHAGHTFESGKKYTLSVFLKCNEGTINIGLKPELGEDPWTGYGAVTVAVTEEWQEFTTTTAVFTEDVNPATITFHISATAGDFWVDSVRWYEGDYVAPTFSSFTAKNPSPEDGAIHPDTWASLSWESGGSATSHDVYFGDNYEDVLNGTEDTFQGNQGLGLTFFVVGFPGYPFEEGLAQGTTYYWRIDEINEDDPNSPWIGDVWSFLVPPKTAYNPTPADGAKFLEPDVRLSWSEGFGTKIHNVYFGENFDDVDAGTGGTAKGPAGVTSFNIGTVEPGKTYYWRIDEFDGLETHKGDIWSFSTAGPGGGIRADYYQGMNFETLALTRTDATIDFNWGDPGGPDPAVGDDTFSVRWSGEVEAAFTETYTFYPRTDDGVRLYVDGELLVDRWVNRSATENKGTIDLIAGNTYSLIMEYYEDGGGAVAELNWSSPRTPKQIIPQAALSLPVKASSPTPRGGSVDVSQTTDLSWGPGDSAASHELYFGTDEEAVRNATTASPEFKGTKALGDESYDPGKLEWATTYYWRVDEINPANADSPWTGNIWSFTTADFLIIDTMEIYDSSANQIWFSWHDGLGYGTPGVDPFFAGNGTGAAVGDETTPSFTEETIVYAGSQSLPLSYDNNKQGYSKYSETELKMTDVRDWTEGDVAHLTLWFRGLPGSVGSFIEGPVGTITMAGAGADITGPADEFHYAYKMLNGAGSIVAKVESVQNTNAWAKAGVMIRETLDPGSAQAISFITPANGAVFEYRPTTGADNVGAAGQDASITAPHWVKIERTISGTFTASHSANGTVWVPVGAAQNIQMGSNVYIGLALTSHDTAQTCTAVFTNVSTSGNVTGQWTNQDIGIASNDPEPLYVAVSNTTGQAAVVVHDNPNAAQLDSWNKWVIPLQDLADQGLALTDVDRLALGLGTRGNTTVPGGSGKMFFDEVRLERGAPAVNLLTNGGFEDGVVDPWTMYDNTTGEPNAVMEIVTDDVVEGSASLHLVIPRAGANFWDVGLSNAGHIFEAGKNYTLSAFMKCKEGTLDVNFKPERGANPYEGYGDQVITISDQWVEYSVTTPVIADNVDPATITFHIGFAPGEIWLDNVRFYEGDYAPPE